MDQKSLNNLFKEYQSKHNKHLTPELDMTSLVLKSHLFLEEILYEIVLLHCKTPKVLEGVQFSFHHKLKLAEALYGVHLYKLKIPGGVWPVLDALNKLRNDLAHKIDSPKLKDKIVNFLTSSEENLMKDRKLRPLNEILFEPKLLTERMRYVLWCLLGWLGCMHGIIYLNPPEEFLASIFAEINLKTSAERVIFPDLFE
ncbi:hypothetical protein [Tatumella ptyseos]|nr:hypothetical protein [Tatumella ptyseos]SQK74447.1 Uncharacterised protein [Tatumella ptyseos]